MPRFDLVIFDCDGVLIDSERLAVRTESQILAELGWPLTEAQVIERFVGRSSVYMQAVIEDHIGRPVDWQVEFELRVREGRSEEHTSELQSLRQLVCRLLLE